MHTLLDEQEIRQRLKTIRRQGLLWICLPIVWLALGFASLFAIQPWVRIAQGIANGILGDSGELVVQLILLAGLFIPFFGLMAVTDEQLKKYLVHCPACNVTLKHRTFVTRRCPKCDEHIVEGPIRFDEVWKRYVRRQTNRLFPRFLWAFAVIGAIAALVGCYGQMMSAGLAGAIMGGVFLGSRRNRRAVLPTLCAFVLVAVGVGMIVCNWP